MKYRMHLPNLVLSIGIACLAITTSALLMQRYTQASRKQRENQRELPTIISNVPTIELVSANIDNRNEENAAVIIEVRNNSEKPIIAISVESGNDKDSSGVSLTGFKSEDEPPAVVIKPYATLKIRMLLSNVKLGAPIKISGVMYLDGTEKGEKEALITLHGEKEHVKKLKKGVTPQQ
jgi:hypothetical protein